MVFNWQKKDIILKKSKEYLSVRIKCVLNRIKIKFLFRIAILLQILAIITLIYHEITHNCYVDFFEYFLNLEYWITTHRWTFLISLLSLYLSIKITCSILKDK